MNRYRLKLIIAILALLLATSCAARPDRPPPTAKDGVLDLTAWQWERDGAVPLAGQWRFAWLGSSMAGPAGEETTLRVPGTWSRARTGDGRLLHGTGYGSYRLTIRHRPASDRLAIRVPNISTAYELYVDGKLALSRGLLGANVRSIQPEQYPGIVRMDGGAEWTELRLIVGNYDHRQGGIRTDLIMGTSEQIDRHQSRSAAEQFIVFGCLLMIGLYHLGLYLLRRKEPANLFFAGLCLLVALRMGLVGEVFLVQWLPWLDWKTATRTEYIALLFSGWSAFAYYERMYPQEFRRSWVRAAGVAGVALAASTLVLPTAVFTTWLPVYQLYVLAQCAIILANLIRSGVKRRDGARTALAGAAVMALAVLNDMLFYNGIWHSIDLVPFGLLFLILMNAYILARRYSQTYERAERLSGELKQWNYTLEERILERTEALRESNETLAQANLELERMEQSRRQLVSNISHDLRTPITLLQGYLEALRDGVISDRERRDATIRLMLSKVEGLGELIQDLFELSVLEARKVVLDRVELTLDQWRGRLDEMFQLDIANRGIRMTCEVPDADDGARTVSIDVHRMDRVFQNLLFNAARYTPDGGTIRIRLVCPTEAETVEVTVEDSGSGIVPEDLPYLFDRFYKKDKSRHSSSGGSGLGLAISKEIVELHGGKISAYNHAGGGGAFRIVLPLAPEEPLEADSAV